MARWSVNRDKVAGLMQIGCDGCAEPSCIGRTYPRAAPLGYAHWPACPEYLITLPDWQYIVELWRLRDLGPIEGFPWILPAYICDTLGHISTALDKRG